jgi:hypothetical protein
VHEIQGNAALLRSAPAFAGAPVIRHAIRALGAEYYQGQLDADGQPVLVTNSDGTTQQAQIGDGAGFGFARWEKAA